LPRPVEDPRDVGRRPAHQARASLSADPLSTAPPPPARALASSTAPSWSPTTSPTAPAPSVCRAPLKDLAKATWW